MTNSVVYTKKLMQNENNAEERKLQRKMEYYTQNSEGIVYNTNMTIIGKIKIANYVISDLQRVEKVTHNI